MKKEILIAIGITILFLGTCITPSVAIDNVKNQSMSISNGNTLYVGGTGEGNYSKIQDAIDDAVDGDTVFVYDDSSPYYEYIIVDKSINLIGEDRDSTIIYGRLHYNYIVNIYADYVNLSGFTIQIFYKGYTQGCIILYSCYNNISCNIIKPNYEGDYFTGLILYELSKNNTIANNIISSGMVIWFSDNNTILDNTFVLNNETEIYVYWGDNNFILNNNITSNNSNGDGIGLYYCSNNIINENRISNHKSGIFLFLSDKNIITNNNISLNNLYGIWIDDSFYNFIYHNNFVNNIQNAKVLRSSNIWDDGKYGNYWSDYKEKYPKARKKPFKGIWDTPYEIEGEDNIDNCPLINQWAKSRTRTMTRNTVTFNSLFHWFLERFPLLEKLLTLVLL